MFIIYAFLIIKDKEGVGGGDIKLQLASYLFFGIYNMVVIFLYTLLVMSIKKIVTKDKVYPYGFESIGMVMFLLIIKWF